MNNTAKINLLLCDPETGVCEIPAAALAADENNKPTARKPVRLIYYTDPICSSCWGIEPQLRKLKLAYGAFFDIEYRMGGLLPGWDQYGGSDVSKPSDVAHHWEEVSDYYDMPIDGDVWLEDPLASSYPPSIAFKAAQLQDEKKAGDFLRRIKEMVFLEKKNSTKWEHLLQAAMESGLDTARFKDDYEGPATALFQEDLAMARQAGVRGYPSVFFTDADENRFLVYGFKPYELYEQALLKLHPQATPALIDASVEGVFAHYPTLTTKEFITLTGQDRAEAVTLLEGLYAQGKIGKYMSKKGPLWQKINTGQLS